jgi:hypothetical protein
MERNDARTGGTGTLAPVRAWRWISLGAVGYALCIVGFSVWAPRTGGVPIDMIVSNANVMTRLQSMSEAEKQAHFWMTLTLDMIFPLIYGMIFALTARSCWGRWGQIGAVVVAIPALLDLIENLIELPALKGNYALLPLKPYVTEAKLAGLQIVGPAIVLTWVCMGVSWLARRIRARYVGGRAAWRNAN